MLYNTSCFTSLVGRSKVHFEYDLYSRSRIGSHNFIGRSENQNMLPPILRNRRGKLLDNINSPESPSVSLIPIQPWPVLLKSVESLFIIQKMVEDIESLTDFQSSQPIFSDKLCEINETISSLASHSTKYLQATFQSGPEANAMQTLWIVIRILIHTSVLKTAQNHTSFQPT